MNNQLTMQSYVLATNDVFRLCAWIALAFAPVILFSLKNKRVEKAEQSKLIIE